MVSATGYVTKSKASITVGTIVLFTKSRCDLNVWSNCKWSAVGIRSIIQIFAAIYKTDMVRCKKICTSLKIGKIYAKKKICVTKHGGLKFIYLFEHNRV